MKIRFPLFRFVEEVGRYIVLQLRKQSMNNGMRPFFFSINKWAVFIYCSADMRCKHKTVQSSVKDLKSIRTEKLNRLKFPIIDETNSGINR